MNEPEHFGNRDDLRTRIERCEPYPSEETTRLMVVDPNVRAALSWSVNNRDLDQEATRTQMMALIKYAGSKHGLSTAVATTALACYEDSLSQANELAKVGIISSSEGDKATIERITELICSDSMMYSRGQYAITRVRKAAHAGQA